jgi:hypothetical protein
MSEEIERPAKRGDAAWKEVREGVATRNKQAHKAAMERREAFDRKRDKANKSRRARYL